MPDLMLSQPSMVTGPRPEDTPEAQERRDQLEQGELPFGLARFLSWTSFLLILASSLMLAVFIGNSARNTLIVRQQRYSLLLAENLNHQIYRRFTLPTVLTFGRVALRQPMQYERLDEVVQSTIHGLHVEILRIYGTDNIINYSLLNTEVGQADTITPAAMQAMQTNEPVFETLSDIGMLKGMVALNLPPRSFILRTNFPLRVSWTPPDAPEGSEPETMVTGVLQLAQDITDDYDTVIRFQWLILGTCLLSSVMLFGLLQMFIVRAERILKARMTRTRKLEAELHENERLVGMGRVVASIAHEIRNPLGIIRSSAELLLRRTGETDAANRRILEATYDEACRLSQTVNDFLDYARPRAPRPHPADLNQVLDQTLCFLDSECQRVGVAIVRHTPTPLPVCGDKDQLYRAFYNIISNALQAIGGEGVIRIRGVVRDDPIKAEDPACGSVQVVEVAIHDSGPGFDIETLPRVLDPFFTTKDQGTGLGLPIVNTIIVGHGGRVEAGNHPEGGGLVRVILPILSPTDLPDA